MNVGQLLKIFYLLGIFDLVAFFSEHTLHNNLVKKSYSGKLKQGKDFKKKRPIGKVKESRNCILESRNVCTT